MSKTPHLLAHKALSALGCIERLGYRAMMDFGLAGFLDRIERDFGRFWAKSLAVLVALAIVAGCLTLIGGFYVNVVTWVVQSRSGPDWAASIGTFANGVLLFVSAIFLRCP